jgi:hypothetical protein
MIVKGFMKGMFRQNLGLNLAIFNQVKCNNSSKMGLLLRDYEGNM